MCKYYIRKSFIKQENTPSLYLNSTQKISELNSTIRNLRPKKAPGQDGVSNNMLKHLGLIARKTFWRSSSAPGGLKDSTPCPSFKERKGQDQPRQLSSDQFTHLCWEAHGTCIISSGSWRPTTYSAPHRQVTVNITALKISLQSSL